MAQLHNVVWRASVCISCSSAAAPSASAPQYKYVRRIAPLTQRPRWYSIDRRPAPARARGGSKVFGSADEAIADVKDGDVILSAGFGLCGVAGMNLYSFFFYLPVAFLIYESTSYATYTNPVWVARTIRQPREVGLGS